MASKKFPGHKEPPKQINIEKLIKFITEEFGESASRKTQLDSSDPSPGTSREENRDKTTPSVSGVSTSGASKRVCSVGIEQQHDSGFKKAKSETNTDPELRYRCSFCSQRFPSLTNVRDHTRACHRQENERRKEERLNTSSTKAVSVHKNMEQESGPNMSQNPERKHAYLFRCIACKFASISYDNMIEHCQNHVIKFEDPQANIPCNMTKKYFICGVKFDIDFETYNECEDGLIHFYTFVNCDYNLLKQDKWPGIFTNLQKSEIDDINYNSMYYFTRIIRLTTQKKPTSAPYMVFQCKKCKKYVDPYAIMLHVQENSCGEHDDSYPCHTCNKPFVNENTMYLHYKMHKTADNSKIKFGVVLFNSYNDDILNALLLKAAGYTMKIIRSNLQKRLISDFAKSQTGITNNQTTKKAAINLQNTPSGSKAVLVSDAAKTKMHAYDARSIIIQGAKIVDEDKTKSGVTSTVTKEVDKLDTVYKCKCELCFHGLEFLLKHFEICGSESKSAIISCICGLLFNEEQYQIHYGIHSQGFTKLNVKTIMVNNEKVVILNNNYNSHLENKLKQIEYNELCRKAISKLIHSIQNVALLHIRGCKDKEITKRKIIAAAAKRSVGSATDELIKPVLKTQGTMTEKNQASNTKSVESGTDDLNTTVMKSQGTMTTPETVCKVNKGVDNIKHLSETKSVGSGTDDLNTTGMKSQGTMTTPETVCKVTKGVDNIKHLSQTISVGSGKDDLNTTVEKSQGTMTTPETVCKVNKGVDNIKHLSQTISVGSGTDDFNTTVMKSQVTMTTPETQTVHKVNKGVDNIKNERQTKSVGYGTDDLITTVMKSQGAMSKPDIQTVHKVNKGVGSITHVSQTKSVVSWTDDLNIPVKKSQETITLPATQTLHYINKELGNTNEKGKTNSSFSRIDKLKSLLLEAQEANEKNNDVTKTVKSSVEKLLTIKNIVNDVRMEYKILNKKLNRGSDNNEENQSMVESTLEAEINEKTFTEKNKVNCDTASAGSKKESSNISMRTECDQIEKVHMNENQGVKGTEAQVGKNNTFEEMETNESEKQKEIKTALCNAESKVYTEDELLSGPETPIYFDAEESILTDDEDPILLYEDDDD